MGEPVRRSVGACARSALGVLRSPADQPRWARPALLTIACLAALSYAWGMGGAALEDYYAAAARSMSMSWHDFLFGAFDPLGTVSVDKLPGALWPQALSLRAFGFHIWAIVLPQVIEGTLTVLVLYRAVRRLAGALAGIIAAAILATSPVTVALNRGNVSDSLLILLTVLAADATIAATLGGRLRHLLAAGAWVGLAFQAKMMQAWLVLPALAFAYLLAAPASARVRVRNVLCAGAVTAAVSLSWISVVALVPASQRPYVDGTTNDSIFTQVFAYNGVARLGRATRITGAGQPTRALARSTTAEAPENAVGRVGPSWHRLLDGLYARDIAWLLPAALIAAVAILLARRGRERTDPLRWTVALWGTWLLVLGASFSAGISLHSYYVAALAPAIASLCGTGAALAWALRESATARRGLAATLLASLVYTTALVSGGSNVPGWLLPATAVLGVTALLLLLGAGSRLGLPAPSGRVALVTLGAALLVPAVAAALMVTRGLGPFAAPFEPSGVTVSRATAKRTAEASAKAIELIASTYEAPIVLAVDTGIFAAPYLLASGRDILPIGGFEGGVPAPTLARLQRYISSGELRALLIPAGESDPRLRWVYAHCKSTEASTGGAASLYLYDCAGA
jgi:4-amino-4-deoxy-L-arabinose transferase-like glycosyltransferase